MTRRYRLSDEAANDLREIYKQGVERFGEVQADTYYDGLHYALNLLGDFPEAARERFELKPPLRVHPKGAHLIVYRIERPGIYVARVLHQRQDWMNLLSSHCLSFALCTRPPFDLYLIGCPARVGPSYPRGLIDP